MALHQFCDKDRGPAAVGDEPESAPGAGHRDVEEPTLLGVRVAGALLRHHELEQRVVLDLGREAELAVRQVEDHDVVGLDPLRGVDRGEAKPQSFGRPARHGRRARAVASEHEPNPRIRGILVAGDFDKRAVMAARAVPNLSLKAYSFQFTFSDR